MTTEPRDVSEILQAALGARYELGAELGRGGMGVVLLARDRVLDREVAVKVIHPQLADHGALIDRFLAEARTVARLRHPNIVAIHEAGEAEGLLYFVMDRVPGETLRDRLQREGRLPTEDAARITADLADALDAAARAGVVHRDVKPENVLLESGTGRALLVDFGIARLQESEGKREITGAGMAVGTPAYMSPEQATGDDDVDPRSDLYALGVVAYEMLAGTPPFTGPNRVVVSHHMSTRPTPVQRRRPDTPPALASAITRALEKAPADRWQTGRAFHEALRGEQPQPVRRSRGLVALAAIVMLVVAGGGVALARRGIDGPPAGVNPRHSILILPFENTRRDADADWLGDASVAMLGLNLSQWTDLNVVDHGRVRDLLKRRGIDDDPEIGLEAARRVARDAGAWTVILGQFERIGDSLSLVARMFDVATGERIDVARVDGRPGNDERPMFDQLAAALLDIAGAPTGIQTGLVAATTPSLEAYRAYLDGMSYLQGWDVVAAEGAFERAVGIDTTFALAWYRLALTRGWILGADDELSRRAMVRATMHAGSLPLHDRLVINAYRAFLQDDLATARTLYREMLARDSSDVEAWYGLGEATHHDPALPPGARLTQAYRAFVRTLALVPDYALAFVHPAEILSAASMREPQLLMVSSDSFAPGAASAAAPAQATARARTALVALARQWVTVQPAALRAHTTLFDALVLTGNLPAALAELERFETASAGHPGFALERARAEFAAGRVDSAAAGLRRTVDSAAPEDFDSWTTGLAAAQEIAAAANVFAYQGDLTRAARALELAGRVRDRFMEATADSASRADPYRAHWRIQVLGQLYAATGGPAPVLRRVWDTAAEAARAAPADERAHVARMGAPAAIGLFAVTAGDTSALHELRAMAGDQPPREVEALLALARQDRAGARRALDEEPVAREKPADGKEAMSSQDKGPTADMIIRDYKAPLEATARYWLGDYEGTVAALQHFEPDRLSTSRWDWRWGMLGRVRLLRAMAFEKLGRNNDAEREYSRVVEQWRNADPALQAYVTDAMQGLARVRGEAG